MRTASSGTPLGGKKRKFPVPFIGTSSSTSFLERFGRHRRRLERHRAVAVSVRSIAIDGLTSILEPSFDLHRRQVESGGQLRPFGGREVVLALEPLLQAGDLSSCRQKKNNKNKTRSGQSPVWDHLL